MKRAETNDGVARASAHCCLTKKSAGKIARRRQVPKILARIECAWVPPSVRLQTGVLQSSCHCRSPYIKSLHSIKTKKRREVLPEIITR